MDKNKQILLLFGVLLIFLIPLFFYKSKPSHIQNIKPGHDRNIKDIHVLILKLQKEQKNIKEIIDEDVADRFYELCDEIEVTLEGVRKIDSYENAKLMELTEELSELLEEEKDDIADEDQEELEDYIMLIVELRYKFKLLKEQEDRD